MTDLTTAAPEAANQTQAPEEAIVSTASTTTAEDPLVGAAPDSGEATVSENPAPDHGEATISANPTAGATRSVSEELWSRAYDTLSKREPDLVQDYGHHMATGEDEAEAEQRLILSNPEAVTKMLQSLRDHRESKQWTYAIQGKSHKAKDQLEKLIKLLTVADGVVKQAVSAQPYAALAWSAVSVFLPVRIQYPSAIRF